MVEGARLERVYRGNSIEGSNPSLTATDVCNRQSAEGTSDWLGVVSPECGGEGVKDCCDASDAQQILVRGNPDIKT